jgi:hypothetical protein
MRNNNTGGAYGYVVGPRMCENKKDGEWLLRPQYRTRVAILAVVCLPERGILYDRAWPVQQPAQDLLGTDRHRSRGPDTQRESPPAFACVIHALCPLLPTAVAFVPYEFVLVLLVVQVIPGSARSMAANPGRPRGALCEGGNPQQGWGIRLG